MGEKQIFNALIEFFEEDEWDFQWMEGLPVLSMGFSGKNGKWICYAQAREPQQQFVFYSLLPINVPDNRRAVVAEFITRANYGMIIGNFEMDFDDGEIRYKTSIDVEGSELGAPMIRQIVYSNVIITDRYWPGLMRVIYGNIAPTAAIAEIENDQTSAPDDSGSLPRIPTVSEEYRPDQPHRYETDPLSIDDDPDDDDDEDWDEDDFDDDEDDWDEDDDEAGNGFIPPTDANPNGKTPH